MRTRVGYAGGTTPAPTCHTIGDHTEAVQVDYDPERVSYGQLLEAFWAMHDPAALAFSRQYESVILTLGDAQWREALDSRERVARTLGVSVRTDVRPLEQFFPAEDYHQKYALRRDRRLLEDVRPHFPGESEFRDSTATARLNGYVYGAGSLSRFEAEMASLGLSPQGERHVREVVARLESRGWPTCGNE